MITEERIIEILGGVRALGISRTPTTLSERVRSGFRFTSLEAFRQRYRISLEQLLELIDISERTMARRKLEKKLTRAESDRLYRVVRIAAQAEEVFGSPTQAERWLKEPNPALGGVTPLSQIDTDAGTQAVADILGRIEHGVFS